jgi:hypothetical protein
MKIIFASGNKRGWNVKITTRLPAPVQLVHPASPMPTWGMPDVITEADRFHFLDHQRKLRQRRILYCTFICNGSPPLYRIQFPSYDLEMHLINWRAKAT